MAVRAGSDGASATPSTEGAASTIVTAGRGATVSLTIPTKRNPLRGKVWIRRWVSPLSPMAARAALIVEPSVDIDTMWPSQTAANRHRG